VYSEVTDSNWLVQQQSAKRAPALAALHSLMTKQQAPPSQTCLTVLRPNTQALTHHSPTQRLKLNHELTPKQDLQRNKPNAAPYNSV